MAIQQQSVPINFAQGLDTKTDPFQVQPGKFLTLQNVVFTKGGLLQKRNGFQPLPSLPNNSNSFATTFNGNLTAIGTSINALSAGTNTWVNKGSIEPIELSTLPLIRSNTNQSQVDTAFALNGTMCTVFTDSVPVGSTTVTQYKFAVSDATTGQNILAPQQITNQVASGLAVLFAPRVFSVGNYFLVVFAANTKLQYIPIAQATSRVISSSVDISTIYQPYSTGSFDGVVNSNNLYLVFNGASNSGLKATYLTPSLSQSNVVTIASSAASLVSVCADQVTTDMWATSYIAGSNSGNIVAFNTSLNVLFSAKQFVNSSTALITNLAPSALNGLMNLKFEVSNSYTWAASIKSDYINQVNCTAAGVVGSTTTLVRSIGLASKAFIMNSVSYFMGAYSSPYQPTYYLMNSGGGVVSRLAYSNGGGYVTTGLPSVYVSGTEARVGYLIKDLIQSVNKDTNVAAGTQVLGIYSQTGINLVTYNFSANSIFSSEIGSNLNLTGGILWSYDGYVANEQNFNYWPESVASVGSGSVFSGSMSAQTYNYQATYEWTDNQGNAFRSAPSIPLTVVQSNSNSGLKISVPTLRLTYKTANPVKIVLYRWSTAQQIYYQCTSIDSPLLNDTGVDSVTFTDTKSDAEILGNNIIYTNGGVVENTCAPACNALTLWQSRLWIVDAEDPNLLWYSKQVIEAAPVEVSDLFTIFVAPTTGAQGSTGPITALSSMDDKLIIFKRNAIYMLNGVGPDNTGANSQFSEPTFITATVGCMNQRSIVFTPNGLMFQSDKGIWLLGRDLSTQYIGAPVEAFNEFNVQSALNIPGTNQVRFTLSNGQTLMYDYYYNQWGTFVNIPAISSTIYQNAHTYINSKGQTFQEEQGVYLDGSSPVLMSFVTSWFNLAGLQGFERAYSFYMLGNYISPHKISMQIAYDYNQAPTQIELITPDNYNGPYGSETLYGGGSPYGGNPTREQWRVFLERQKCQAFQITMNEIFDPSYGVQAGGGFTMSGLNLLVGAKGTYPRLPSGKSVG